MRADLGLADLAGVARRLAVFGLEAAGRAERARRQTLRNKRNCMSQDAPTLTNDACGKAHLRDSVGSGRTELAGELSQLVLISAGHAVGAHGHGGLVAGLALLAGQARRGALAGGVLADLAVVADCGANAARKIGSD